MGYFRQNDVRMWGDDKFRRLSAPRPCGRYLWLYLLNGPHTLAIPGVSSVGELAIAEALEWSLKDFRKAFAEVSTQGMAKADWKSRILWLPNAVKYNWPASPNVVKSWSKSWDVLPECGLLLDAWAHLNECLSQKEAFGKAFREACRKPFPKAFGEQKQEQEQEQEQERNIPPSAAFVEGFDLFWSAYPRKEKKQDARKAWDRLAPNEALWAMMRDAIAIQSRSRQWMADDGRYIPHPATWINGRRWEDQPTKATNHGGKFDWAKDFMGSDAVIVDAATEQPR